MSSKPVFLATLSLFLLIACNKETADPIVEDTLDLDLMSALDLASPTGRFFHFILANENDLEHLPNQDPSNQITRNKVNLGKSIFFDPGLAQDALDGSCY